jgi:uncharacterized membrane protein YdjX (TVP38/TMEM64 family)
MIPGWQELQSLLAGPWGPVGFVLLYVLCAVALLPVLWLNVLAGALFGPWWGTALILLGIGLGSSASFGLSKKVLRRDWLLHRFGRYGGLMARLSHERHSWKALFLLRMANVGPFSVINYLAAALDIRYSRFLLATLLGSVPGSVLATGLGALLFRGWLERV